MPAGVSPIRHSHAEPGLYPRARPAESVHLETIAIRAAEAADIPSMVGLLRELFAIEDDFSFDAARQEAGLRLLLDGDERQRCMRVAAAANASVVGMGTA